MTTAKKRAAVRGAICGILFAMLTSAYSVATGRDFDLGVAVFSALVFGMGMTAFGLHELRK